jgi:predicted Zn finger-like uncharacterized protein
MDVRCERCRAQYVFDDDQVTPQGLTVQCTNCGHVFRVKKKELVVTVPVRPEDVTEQPFLARMAAQRPGAPAAPSTPRPAAPAAPPAERPAAPSAPPASVAAATAPPPDAPHQGWTIRQAGGVTLGFTELTTLQKWIVERRVSPDDEVTQGDGAWLRLGAIEELQPFFDVVVAADRGRRAPPPPTTAPKPTTRPGGTDFYPPPPFPPPSFANLQGAAPQASGAGPAGPAEPYVQRPAGPAEPSARRPAGLAEPSARRPAAAPASLTTELDPEELAAVRGQRSGRTRLAVGALLLVTAGAVAYVFGPTLVGRDARPPPAPPPAEAPASSPPSAPAPTAPEPVSVAVPLTIELKAPPEAGAPVPPPEVKPAIPEPGAAPPKPGEGAAAPRPAGSAEPSAPRPAGSAEPSAPRPAGPKALMAQARKAREGGEFARAVDLYGKALAAEPDNVDALTGRGLCYFELGQYAPAEASFQRALQLDLEHPDAIMGLAETYRQQGKKAEALKLFERYLAVHPDGEEAAVARYAISQLKE